jgi:quinohemoprotein amine dehydrogenase
MEPPRVVPVNANAKYPVDLALDYLNSAQPLITPEWEAWHAAMRAPKLAGTWLLTGYQPGRGKIYGQVIVTPGATEDEFTTNVQFTYANGTAVKLAGKGVVYTGYSWRGHAVSGAAPKGATPAANATMSPIPVECREAMMVSRDGNTMDGRYFWSSFGELGIDVHLVRLGSEPVVLGADLASLQSPSKHELKIYGGNLPTSLKPADIDLGPGVMITKIVRATPTLAVVEVEVAKGLPVGIRDLSIGRATAVKALAVYDKIAYVQVTPDAQSAKLGGVVHPKELAQFDVVAYAAGPDGKAHTADDVPLGPVSAKWSLEEFFSTPDDDDVKFVGTMDDSGLFTPNIEGPNPARKKQDNNFGVNNYGDVWVVADFKTPDGTELKAKSYLVVTVPNYTIYDQAEVEQ